MTARYRCFISYGRKDDPAFVEKLYHDLNDRLKLPVWRDLVDMPSDGRSFRAEIKDAIEASERVVLVLGPHALASREVIMEWEYALSICKPVVPVLRKGKGRFETLVPDVFKNIPGSDFREGEDDEDHDYHYDNLLAKLVAIIAPDAPPLGKLINVPMLPPRFQPRPIDLEAIKAALLRDVNQPVVVTAPARRAGMQGMGGIGKSVLASAIAHDCDIRRSYPQGVIWVNLGQEPSLTARLADVCRALGDPPGTTFADLQSGQARLSELISDKACLLILDDLWLLDHAKAFTFDSPRSSLLVTTRLGELIEQLGAFNHRVDKLSETEALRLMARHLTNPDDTPGYDEPEQIKRLDDLITALPSEARAVAAECGYLPLALAVNAAYIREGADWKALLEALTTTTRFAEHPSVEVLRTIQISVDSLARENPAAASHYHELAVFPEDALIPEAALMTLWLHTNSLNKFSAQTLIGRLGKRNLLIVEGQTPHRTIRLHDLQQDYVRLSQPDSLAVHQAFLEAYQKHCGGDWSKGPNDGYFFERLSYHLHAARRLPELYDLLTSSPAWMEAKFTACVGDASTVDDLTLALKDFTDPLSDAGAVLNLVKLWAVRYAIDARVSSYNDAALRALVMIDLFLDKDGRRIREALSHARLRTDTFDRFWGLMTIFQTLREHGTPDPAILQEAWRMAADVEDSSSQAGALQAVVTALVRDGRIEHALVVARDIRVDHWKVSALITVGAALKKAGDSRADEMFEQTLQVAAEIEENYVRAHTLGTIAAALVDVGKIDQAREVAVGIEDSYWRAEAWSAMAAALAKAGDSRADEMFEQAREVAERIEDDHRREEAQSSMAAALAAVGKIDQAREVAVKIEVGYLQAYALGTVAAALADVGKIDQAREVAVGIEHGSTRAHALGAVAAALAKASDSRASEMFEQAREVTAGIEHSSTRAQALGAVAAALAKASDSRADEMFEQAREVAVGIEEDYWRVDAMRTVATAMTEGGMFEQAREVVVRIEDRYSRLEYLNAVAAALAAVGKIDQAREVAAEIKDSYWRAEAWSAMAAALAKAGDSRADEMFEQAREVAERIEDDHRREEAQSSMAAALAAVGKIDQAREVAVGIEDSYWREEAWSAVAAALAKAGDSRADEMFEQAREVAERIEDDHRREEAQSSMAAALAAVGKIDQAREVAAEIEDSYWRAEAWSAVGVALARGGAFEQALAVLTEIDYGYKREESLNRVAKALAASEKIDQAREVAAGIEDSYWRADALRELASSLAQAGRLSDALNTLPLRDPAEFIRSLAEWQAAFEQVAPGLSVTVLREAARILGWVRPSWREVYQILSSDQT